MSFYSYDSFLDSKKCAVIGCQGTGAMIAYLLAQSTLTNSLVLIDQDKRLSDGQAADICGALPLRTSTDVWAGDFSDLNDCDLIILTCGAIPLHECAHADLIALNMPIIRRAVAGITAHNDRAIILVLTEPMDIMTYTVLRYTDFPQERVIGLGTVARSFRLRGLLGKYLGMDPDRIDAMILGQSDEHACVCWSGIRVCGMTLDAYLQSIGRSMDFSVLQSLYDDTLHAFERCEDAKGRAEFSLAFAALHVADAVLNNRNSLFTPSVLSDGYCDLSHVCMSLPCLIGRQGAHVLYDMQPALAEMELLSKSAARLKARMLDAEQLFLQK